MPSSFFFQAEDGIRDGHVTGVQTCALPIYEDDQPMKRSFSKNKSVLCSSISSFLEEEGLNDIKLEHIFRESDNRRQVLDKLYRVPVPVSKCRITGLHDKDVEVLELTQ